MIKSRPNFREDSINIKTITNNISVIKNIDEEPEVIRGRRMTSTNIATKKNNSTTCDSKDRITKKGKKHNKPEKKIDRKNIPKQSESDKSYSDHSIKKRRQKVLKIKKDTIITTADDRSDDDTLVSANYEDNLYNEIERILIEIINNHVNNNLRKNEIDIIKFERHINYISESLNKHYNIFILQILSDKIKEIIQQLKEKLLEIPEIAQLRDKFIEFHSELKKGNQIIEPCKCVTKTLLNELKNIKISLINSAKDIERVFKKPFNILFNKAKFCIEDVLREVYVSIILKDDFINNIISYTKSKIKTEEMIVLTDYLEEDKKKSGMSIFLNYLNEQLNIIMMDECKREEEEEMKIKLTIKKSNDEFDLDELVKFIQNEENKPKKKNKKKKKINNKEDMEIEEFRAFLLNSSRKASEVKKVKPNFTEDWIRNLVK